MTGPVSNYHGYSDLAALKKEAAESPQDAIMPVARQFESVFLQMMLKSMRETVPESGLFSDEAGKAYRDMFDNQLSVNLAEQGGIGLAKVMVKQLTPAPHSAETQALQLSLRQAAVITTTTTGPVEQ